MNPELPMYESNFALIRPEQIVAWSGATADADAADALFDLPSGRVLPALKRSGALAKQTGAQF